MTNEAKTRAKVRELYKNLGWPSLFARLKFYFAPLQKIEALIPKKGLIVDLGCGYGLFSHYIGIAEPARTVLGFDLDLPKVTYGMRSHPNVTCQHGDITKVDIPPADCIVFTHVLHHLTSYEAQKELLLSCKNKLASGGTLIITEVGDRPLWKHFFSYLADKILYPKDKLHFRSQKDMEYLLAEIFGDVTVIPMDKGTIFPHVTFVCVKHAP